MPLTDAKIRAAKAAEKAFKMPDGGGLHLFVTPAGAKSWRYRYERDGKEQTAVLGRYPEMGLAGARRARDDARSKLRSGAVVVKTAPSFEVVAREWHELNQPRWKPHHAADVLASLVAEVFPAIGRDPVDSLTGVRLLEVLRPIEQRGAVETARRVKQRCSAVFGYAIAKGSATGDPTSGLNPALAPLPPKGRRPAVGTLDEARALIRAIDGCTASPAVRIASRFLALTAQRPGEVAGLPWSELRLAGPEPEWRLPPERTKTVTERARSAVVHVVPLSPAAVACLEALRPLTGRGALVFPNMRSMSKPMSENALGDLMERLGYRGRHVPHGWRSTFSTVMNELFPADRQVIDLMLAHKPKDRVEAAYNRAQHMARRRELAVAWADLLLEGAAPIDILVSGPRRVFNGGA